MKAIVSLCTHSGNDLFYDSNIPSIVTKYNIYCHAGEH